MNQEQDANKEKGLWSTFFDEASEKLQRFREERLRRRLEQVRPQQEKLDELADKVKRGRLAKEFARGEFWQEVLLPYLRQEAVLRPWAPKDNEPAPDQRALHAFVFGSGQVRVLTRVLAQLEQWQADGEEAERALQAEAERRKKIEEVTRR